MIQPPNDYELWSPKKGDVYPQGYLYGGYNGDLWTAGSYPGRRIQDDLRGYFCRPKLEPEIKTDPNPSEQPTIDKVFITERPQYSALLELSLIWYEVGKAVRELADSNEASVTARAMGLDEIIGLLRKAADDILFTDHKETSDAE